MKTHKALQVPFVMVGAAFLWAAAPGCGPSVGAYCDKVCDCVGCSDSERTECVDAIEDVRKQAEEAGCGSEFNDVLSCANSELECTNDSISADGCESEADALNKCGTSTGGGIGNTVCDIAVDAIYAKYEACAIAVEPGGETGECTEALGKQATCVAACVDAASCETLKGEDSEGAQAFSDCLSVC